MGRDPVETHFVYDGDALVLELSPSGQPLVQYVWGLLGPVARVDLQNGSNTRYYVLDARGHARALVDSTGSVTDYYEYDAWGNVLPGSFGSNPFKWNAAGGYQHVPFTGLYHVGAREYDPRTARWLQRDPIGQSSGDPNLYRYCGNDAVNLSDPSGLWPVVDVMRWLVPKQLSVTRADPRWPQPDRYKNHFLLTDPMSGNSTTSAIAAWVLEHRVKISETIASALAIQHKYFPVGTKGNYNGPGDALRHCVWACLVTKRLGIQGYEFVVVDHEDGLAYWAKGKWDPFTSPMDMANNEVGLRCASNKNSTCEASCIDQLLGGKLFTLPKNTWAPDARVRPR